MTEEEIRQKIDNDPDFINSKKYNYSLNQLLSKFQKGVSYKTMAEALMMNREDVIELVQKTIGKLRGIMKVEIH